VKTLYGRWVTGREVKAYRILAGLPAVPAFLGCLDPLAFALEYRPGTQMSRSLAGRLPEGFMGELRAAVREMHTRGVVHLDLRHRSNLLADSDGHPVLIDFGSALFLRPGSLLSRILSPILARIDWSAVRKWEVRVAPKPG
jgi:serine/threonine protein kinase